jgi:hypothetical protein
MIDQELREKMFAEYIFKHDQGILQRGDDTDIDVAERSFNAALDLTLPLLGQSLEANREVVNLHKTTEMFEYYWKSKIIVKTALAAIESELKQLGGGE